MATIEIISLLLTFALFVFGTIVTVHPPSSKRAKAVWIGLLIAFGIGSLALQIRKVQDDAIAKVASDIRENLLLEDAQVSRREAEQMRTDQKIEVARRQQAEKDLALKVQSVGQETRAAVTEDLRQRPPQSGQAVISARLWDFKHTPPKTTFDVMVENDGNLRTNVTIVPTLYVDGKVHPLQNLIKPNLELVPLSYQDFDIAVTLSADEDASVWEGKSELSLQLTIDYAEQPGGKLIRFTYRGRFDVAQKRMVSTSERTPL